jgi:hypothetical protein
MDRYEINIVSNGIEGTALAFVDMPENDLYLRLEAGGVSHETVDFDCLTAFNFLRNEKFSNVDFLCNGARRNFVQSAMMQQSGGLYGYLVRIGEPSSLKETGFIFDYCPRELIVSVAEQQAFRQEWHNSFS